MTKKEKEGIIVMNGVCVEVLPDRKYRVKLENDHVILTYLKGGLEVKRVRVFEGDKVTVELSIHDLTRGRIVEKERIARTFDKNKKPIWKKAKPSSQN